MCDGTYCASGDWFGDGVSMSWNVGPGKGFMRECKILWRIGSRESGMEEVDQWCVLNRTCIRRMKRNRTCLRWGVQESAEIGVKECMPSVCRCLCALVQFWGVRVDISDRDASFVWEFEMTLEIKNTI